MKKENDVFLMFKRRFKGQNHKCTDFFKLFLALIRYGQIPNTIYLQTILILAFSHEFHHLILFDKLM